VEEEATGRIPLMIGGSNNEDLTATKFLEPVAEGQLESATTGEQGEM
jgi:hypothetical protein